MTMARTIKLYKLPDTPATPGIRPMEPRDVPGVARLLAGYLERYKLAPHMDEAEVAHWWVAAAGAGQLRPRAAGRCRVEGRWAGGASQLLGCRAGGARQLPPRRPPPAPACPSPNPRLLPREGVVDAYVVEGGGGQLLSLASFYSLPSTVLGHPEHTDLRAAYCFYTVPGPTPLKQLMSDALILARAKGWVGWGAADRAGWRSPGRLGRCRPPSTAMPPTTTT
jgi:hypothetical protein